MISLYFVIDILRVGRFVSSWCPVCWRCWCVFGFRLCLVNCWFVLGRVSSHSGDQSTDQKDLFYAHTFWLQFRTFNLIKTDRERETNLHCCCFVEVRSSTDDWRKSWREHWLSTKMPRCFIPRYLGLLAPPSAASRQRDATYKPFTNNDLKLLALHRRPFSIPCCCCLN